VYDAIYIENKGKPTCTYIFRHFHNDALSAASSKGMPVIGVVKEDIVSECTVIEEIDSEIEKAFPEVIEVLTKPVTGGEITPQYKDPHNTPRLIYKGSLEEVNRFFYQSGWTDGLPIIPPTEAAVKEMMTGTDHAPDYLVEKLEPRLGKATVEKIAVNAVMAGCLPTYMPYLIAGVHALAANPSPGMMAVSTGSWSPFWLLNGPASRDCNFRSTYGAASPGDIANATFGRAMGLITKNIRGLRKQVEDMGVLGNPGKYSFVAAENEENSPWQPNHVDYGFNKDDSTVTLMFPNTYQQMMPFGTDDKGILGTVLGSIFPARIGSLAVLMTPNNAQALASRGWTKQKVMEHIIEKAVVPPDYYSRLGLEAEKIVGKGLMTPDSIDHIFTRSDRDYDPVRVFVYGGFGSWVGLLQGGSAPIVKKAELPKNWVQLVSKYKNIVPSYVRY
jgi:hypothetical protein